MLFKSNIFFLFLNELLQIYFSNIELLQNQLLYKTFSLFVPFILISFCFRSLLFLFVFRAQSSESVGIPIEFVVLSLGRRGIHLQIACTLDKAAKRLKWSMIYNYNLQIINRPTKPVGLVKPIGHNPLINAPMNEHLSSLILIGDWWLWFKYINSKTHYKKWGHSRSTKTSKEV